jgi:hypothetical protein
LIVMMIQITFMMVIDHLQRRDDHNAGV